MCPFDTCVRECSHSHGKEMQLHVDNEKIGEKKSQLLQDEIGRGGSGWRRGEEREEGGAVGKRGGGIEGRLVRKRRKGKEWEKWWRERGSEEEGMQKFTTVTVPGALSYSYMP